jgi:hypothetical protein
MLTFWLKWVKLRGVNIAQHALELEGSEETPSADYFHSLLDRTQNRLGRDRLADDSRDTRLTRTTRPSEGQQSARGNVPGDKALDVVDQQLAPDERR